MVMVGYAADNYDACQKRKEAKGKKTKFRGSRVEQGVNTLHTCRDDVIEAKEGLFRYGFTDVINLFDNPTIKVVSKSRRKLQKRLESHPDETFLVAYIIAGHGMSMDGR